MRPPNQRAAEDAALSARFVRSVLPAGLLPAVSAAARAQSAPAVTWRASCRVCRGSATFVEGQYACRRCFARPILAGWGVVASLMFALCSAATILFPEATPVLQIGSFGPMGVYEVGVEAWRLIRAARIPFLKTLGVHAMLRREADHEAWNAEVLDAAGRSRAPGFR